jgi:ParB family chromosome partitioning protein
VRSEIPVSLLKAHPKNQEYYSNLSDEKYQEIKRSIEAHGIRDPLKVLPDYTVVAGHQRLRIARELGLEKVPVVILDVSLEEAEYLLIADNEERRQFDDNPIRKAKRAEFLKRYWGVREGRLAKPGTPEGHFVPQVKTLADVAEAIGETEKSTKRLLKLNDLIPSLQDLVSRSKLSQAAAYSLAFLPPEEQENLLNALGESGVCGLSVAEAKELRARIESALKERDDLAGKLAESQERERELDRKLSALQDQLESAREDIAERLSHEYQEKTEQALSNLKRQLKEARDETAELWAKLKQAKAKVTEKIVSDPKQETEIKNLKAKIEELEKQLAENNKPGADIVAEIERLESEKRVLEWEVNRTRQAVVFGNFVRKLFTPLMKAEDEYDNLVRQTELRGLHFEEARRWIAMLKRYQEKLGDAMRTVESGAGKVIDISKTR